MRRHFFPGWKATVGGFDFRVEAGRKAAIGGEDLRLDVWDERFRTWRPVAMEIGFLLADFFFENEEVRYPSSAPEEFRGGNMYMSECWLAVKRGYRHAAEKLRRERASLPDPIESWLP